MTRPVTTPMIVYRHGDDIPWERISEILVYEDCISQPDRNVENPDNSDVRKLHELWEQSHLSRLLEHYRVDCVFNVGADYGQYAEMLRPKA